MEVNARQLAHDDEQLDDDDDDDQAAQGGGVPIRRPAPVFVIDNTPVTHPV